jgi:hypothetical protein
MPDFANVSGGRFRQAVVCIAAIVILTGCSRSGPELAPVSGQVTLDGKPVEHIKVTFHPDGSKSPSIGRTDKDGRYLLRYKRGVEGGSVGWNVVRLQTVTEASHGPQLVHERYITGSDLRREVKPSKNTFDFELNELGK